MAHLNTHRITALSATRCANVENEKRASQKQAQSDQPAQYVSINIKENPTPAGENRDASKNCKCSCQHVAEAFCDPEKFTNKERAETFIMIAEKNLEIRELAGELAAQVALYQAFPCKYD